MKNQTLLFIFILLSISSGAQIQVNDPIAPKDSIHTYNLGEIEVIANQNIQRLSKGGLITEVRNTALSELGTCRDVLSQLPGVRADIEKIEIIGRGSPQIYINGRKLIDSSELDRLSSREIRNVEIVYNPGDKIADERRRLF